MSNSPSGHSKPLLEYVEFLGRGQAPSYIEGDFEVIAVNQKCVREGTVDVNFGRSHDPLVNIKDTAFLREGDICVNSTGTGTIGRVGLWSPEASGGRTKYFVDTHVTIVRPKQDEVSPRFMAALLASHPFQIAMETLCFTGSTNQIELNGSSLGGLHICLPRKEIQNKIAEVFEKSEAIIAETEGLIEKRKRIKGGVMHELLVRGLDAKGAIRSGGTHEFKMSPIGRIPVSWSVKSVEELLNEGTLREIQDGNHGELHPKSSDFVPEGVPFVMASDIAGDLINFDRVKRIKQEQYAALRIGFSRAGDVLLSHKASVGFVAVVPKGVDEIMLTPQVTYYRIGNSDRLHMGFLAQSMRAEYFQRQLSNLAKQSTRDYIGIVAQRQLLLVVPEEITEQSRIAEQLNTHDVLIDELGQELSKWRRLNDGLSRDLLRDKALTPKLVEQVRAA